MTLYDKIINSIYPEAGQLRDILLTHSRCVAEYACEIAARHSELDIDKDFVYTAAMLHDIGIIKCDADGIQCFGAEPYIRHGILGAQMLRENAAQWGMTADEIEPFARVCERHTGTGLTRQQIEKRNLPLPHTDLVPETIEEQVICYADKFFSKTRPEERKSLERTLRSLEKFGEEGVRTFMKWHEVFG